MAGGVAAAIVGVGLAYFLVMLARRARTRSWDFMRTVGRVNRALVPLLAFPFIAALKLPNIEKDSPKTAIFFAVLAAVATGTGAYAWGRGERLSPRFDDASELDGARSQGPARSRRPRARKGRAVARAGRPARDVGGLRPLLLPARDHQPPRAAYPDARSRVLRQHLLPVDPRTAARLLLAQEPATTGPRTSTRSSSCSRRSTSSIRGRSSSSSSSPCGSAPASSPCTCSRAYKLAHRGKALLLAAVWAIYPALHGANMYEFHSLALISPLVVWLLYAYETGRDRLYWFTFAVLLLCREDVPLLMCFVGLYAILDRRGVSKARLGWVTIAMSLVYFVIVKLFFMTSPGIIMSGKDAYSYAYYYEELIPNRSGLGGLLVSLLTNPIFVLKLLTEEPRSSSCSSSSSPSASCPSSPSPGAGCSPTGSCSACSPRATRCSRSPSSTRRSSSPSRSR